MAATAARSIFAVATHAANHLHAADQHRHLAQPGGGRLARVGGVAMSGCYRLADRRLAFVAGGVQ